MKIKTAKALAKTLDSVLQMAVENSCCCGDVVDGRGYLGHDTGCYVHQYRKQLKRVEEFIDELEAGKHSISADILNGIVLACAGIKAGGPAEAFGFDNPETRRDYEKCEKAFDWAQDQRSAAPRKLKTSEKHVAHSGLRCEEMDRAQLKAYREKASTGGVNS